MHHAPAQEGTRELALLVGGDHHQRRHARRARNALGARDLEAPLAQGVEQPVRDCDVGLVDLVEQDHRAHRSRRAHAGILAARALLGRLGVQGPPERARADEVSDRQLRPVGLTAGDLGFSEASDDVDGVQQVARLGAPVHAVVHQRPLRAVCDGASELGLASARLSGQQQRAAGGEGGVDGQQVGPLEEVRRLGVAVGLRERHRPQVVDVQVLHRAQSSRRPFRISITLASRRVSPPPSARNRYTFRRPSAARRSKTSR